MSSSSEDEASPFVLSGKTSPLTGEDNEDSYVGEEHPPDSENCAENPPADENAAGAVAENDSTTANKRKHSTRDEKARKKNQMATWAQGMKLHDFILTREGLMLKLLVP